MASDENLSRIGIARDECGPGLQVAMGMLVGTLINLYGEQEARRMVEEAVQGALAMAVTLGIDLPAGGDAPAGESH